MVVLGACVALVVLSFGVFVLAIADETPPLSQLQPIDEGANSIVYAEDGSRLGFIQSDESRTPIGLDQMPLDLQEATVAIEDSRFYEHGGVDIEGIARAAYNNITSGETKEGGSTITQQLARNLYIADPQRDIERKIREAKLAEEIESAHSKDWILNQYLNTASYGTIEGRTAIGVEAAAQTYFSKPAKDLDLAQSALLAGLPQSPSDYNPLINPRGALERRNEVLQKMADQHYISQETAQQTIQDPIELHPGSKYTQIREPFFFDYVEQQLIDKYGVNTVRKGGLKVYTTIDPKLQAAGTASIDSHLNEPGDPSSAVVAIDPNTGYIRAMASSASYAHDQYNLAAQGHRQPGSAFKVFALTTAIERGVNPDTTTYTSKPLDLNLPEFGHWNVSTYSNSYSGTITLHQATLQSDNTVFAQLALDLGPQSIADTAHKMGITSELDGLPAETLGGLRVGVSPLEMADAYATLASGGIHNDPIAIKKVQFPDGSTDDIGEPQRNRVFSDAVAYEVTKILHDNIIGGTGTAANTGCIGEAGKTGTTDDFNDAWFVGYNPNLATSVWVGYPDALRSMSSVHGIAVAGGTFPAEIWHDFMQVALANNCEDFPKPTSTITWIPFHGEFADQSGGASCTSTTGSFNDVTGSGSTCGEPPPEPDTNNDKKNQDNNGNDNGAFAPGKGQKPSPKPKPTPNPTPEPTPTPGPPSGGITP
jgi:penicillin-binding protein 1A